MMYLMALIKKNLTANIVGTTRTGKYIHKNDELNVGFKKQEHLDAYYAFARLLMANEFEQTIQEKHRTAMNQHYLAAVAE